MEESVGFWERLQGVLWVVKAIAAGEVGGFERGRQVSASGEHFLSPGSEPV